jgi:Tfp pilus assembly protein PilX
MSEFKISPVTQCNTRSGRGFLFWFLLVILVIVVGVSSWMFFRLSSRISAIERLLQARATEVVTTEIVEAECGGRRV